MLSMVLKELSSAPISTEMQLHKQHMFIDNHLLGVQRGTERSFSRLIPMQIPGLTVWKDGLIHLYVRKPQACLQHCLNHINNNVNKCF